MIDEEMTVRMFGYNSDMLTYYSNKNIVVMCNNCGLYRINKKNMYKDLCLQCSREKSDKERMLIRQKQSATWQGISLLEWKNFINKDWRDYDKAIFLNTPFINSIRHHLTKTMVAYIPNELHNHIGHNLKTGKGMAEMNIITL